MDVTLRNGRFTATVAFLGAELRSLIDLKSGREVIWQADPRYWKGSAPVLFPVVGGLNGGGYTFDGKRYELPQHGFARRSEFRVATAGPDRVELVLDADDETRKVYPFEFTLRCTFRLEETGISADYYVTNRGGHAMYFSLGFHPAFNVPFVPGLSGSFENYYVLFEKSEENERWFFDSGMVVAGRSAEVLSSSRVLGMTPGLFDHGPVIFHRPQSRTFTIVHGTGSDSVRLSIDAPPPNMAVWSKPGAPFLCLEPWYGLPDRTDGGGDLRQKADIIELDAGAGFGAGYRVEVT